VGGSDAEGLTCRCSEMGDGTVALVVGFLGLCIGDEVAAGMGELVGRVVLVVGA
jgi:hypothetical protein